MRDEVRIDDTMLVRRRRAIVHALTGFLPRAQVLEALAVWHDEYRHGRSAFDGLTMYARQVCARFDRAGLHSELVQRLTQAFYLDDHALPPDPWPIAPPPATHPPAPAGGDVPAVKAGTIGVETPPVAPPADRPDPLVIATTASPDTAPPASPRPAQRTVPPEVATWLKVVMRLARELAAQDRPAAAALPRAILGGATRAGVDAEARELVRLALEDKLSPRLDRLAVHDLHALLNLAYVHAATAVGPVLADRMLSTAIRSVENSAVGAAFSPRKLL
jgi:hypothetical protein